MKKQHAREQLPVRNMVQRSQRTDMQHIQHEVGDMPG